MPYIQPSSSDVHIDQALTNMSVAFLQADTQFVARRVFPEIPVMNQSNKYFVYDRGEWNRNQMRPRAPGTEADVGTMAISAESYLADVFALARIVPDEVRSNADSPVAPDREAAAWLAQQALLNLETGWAATYFAPGDPGDTWTFDADGVASSATAAGLFDPRDAGNNQILQWNDASSTPIEDIRRAKRTVGEATGFRPNTLVLGRPVFDTLLDHGDIVGRLDRGQTAGPAMATRDSLAALLEVANIYVMDAIQNTAAEGADAVHSYIGGKHALLIYSAPAPGLMTPSAGYTFRWTGIDGSVPGGAQVTRLRDDKKHSDWFEIQTAYDQKLISADLGCFFGSIVA